MSKPICLDLGCGRYPVQLVNYDTIKVDSNKEVNPDILCDLRKLPYPDESIDAIYAGHILEHFSFRETNAVLKEWFRVLKVGGDIVIKVPNIAFAIDLIAKEGHINYDALSIFYGSHEDKGQYHYNAFTVRDLDSCIKEHDGIEGDCLLLTDCREIQFQGTKVRRKVVS